jgi:hypothetical protein
MQKTDIKPATGKAQISDRLLTLRGEFSMVVKDKSGKIVDKYEDKNLIVNLAKTALARLLSGGGAGREVTKIAFGTSSIAPDVADTVITNAVTKNLDGFTFPEFNSVSFAWTLDYAEGNGINIAEFGLLSSDSSLFARKTRTAIAKSSDLLLTGIWKIVF